MQQDKFALALAKQNAGRAKEAAALFYEILNGDPDHAFAYHNLGLIILEASGPGAAIPFFWYAARLKPDLPDSHNSLGNALLKAGRWAEAESAFRRAIETGPKVATFHFNLANLLAGGKRYEEAEQLFLEAIRLDPENCEAHNNFGNTLRSLNRPDEAMDEFVRALEIRPKFSMACNNIGNLYRDKGDSEQAERSYREAIRLDPKLAIAYFNLGNVLRETGRLKQSAENFRKAIEYDARHADSYRHLVQVERIKPDDGLVAFMQARYEDPLLTDGERVHLGFALGWVFDQNSEWDRAFEYMRTANRLHRKTFKYAPKNEDYLKRISQFFTPARVASMPNSELADRTPIFIVGMMRSGTTLIEQILASHPEVEGGGELRFIQELVNELKGKSGKPYPDCLENVTGAEMAAMGETYLRRARELCGTGARFITDKMPQNFLYLGLINRILPEARIIYMKRDSRDVAMSIFSILFTEPHPYAYDLADIGRYCRFSERVMDCWMKLIPSKIRVQSYESLVENSETAIREVLDFCGLPFDPACLDFHRTKRKVTTASASQVREKLTAKSIGRWKNYDRHLGDLNAALAGN